VVAKVHGAQVVKVVKGRKRSTFALFVPQLFLAENDELVPGGLHLGPPGPVDDDGVQGLGVEKSVELARQVVGLSFLVGFVFEEHAF
jgi:hypothetical protein